jgi:hypothetical protein
MEAARTPPRVVAASDQLLYRPAAIGESKLAASHDGRTSAEFVSGGCLPSGPVTMVIASSSPASRIGSFVRQTMAWPADVSGIARRRAGATPEMPRPRVPGADGRSDGKADG